jgi:hypothetical protein
LDNAGENTSFEKSAKNENLGITFEYTAPGTPQQNGLVERAFATLTGRVRAMMNQAGIPINIRERLWAEAAGTATKLESILVHDADTSYKKFFGTDPPYKRHLRVFGEIAVTSIPDRKLRPKVDDRGRECMFVGYAEGHAGNVYRFLRLRTNKIIFSRDIIWMKKLYAEHMNIRRIAPVVPINNDDSDDDDDDDGTGGAQQVGGAIAPAQIPIAPLPPREQQRLQTWAPLPIQPGRTRAQTRAAAIDEAVDMAFIGTTIPSSEWTEPRTFREAMESPQRHIWLPAIKLELRNMRKREVWRIVKKGEVPPNRRLIGCKWIFKLKADGTARARVVAQGFGQIPGVDFMENYAPVLKDETFRLVLVYMLIKQLESEQIDVETAFLHGDLEEKIYMRCPEGLDCEDDECILLEKAMYGLVQAARQWYKKFVAMLRSIGFIPSLADPCMLCKEEANGDSTILVIYVDDCICIGTRVAINQAISDIASHFIIKRMGPVYDYVGCRIIKPEGNNAMVLIQPQLLNSLEKKFGDLVSHMRRYNTPGGPNEVVMRPHDGDALLTEDDQKLYRSGVGMLLYLTKHSRPDISNAVRELSKVMDGATEAHMKMMLRGIKYVLDTKDKGLRICPTEVLEDVWILRAFSDSDYSGDRDQRLSVTGYIIYLMGVAIAWASREQRNVTLSSTEAEYVAVSEVCREILFIAQVMEFLGMTVQKPIVVRVDNIGAIYLANNQTTSQRTKHVDVRYHFVREYIEEGIVEIVFVRSKDNDADVFTKNLDGEAFWRHANKMIGDDHTNNRKGVGE